MAAEWGRVWEQTGRSLEGAPLCFGMLEDVIRVSKRLRRERGTDGCRLTRLGRADGQGDGEKRRRPARRVEVVENLAASSAGVFWWASTMRLLSAGTRWTLGPGRTIP